MSRPLILAHRGLTHIAPENTYEAVAAAVAHGVAGLEIDVRPTRDGQLVCIHDDNAARIAALDRRIADMSVDEIRKLTITRPHPDDGTMLTGRPLFYEELLELTRHKFLLNIEVKGGNWKSDFLAERLIEPLQQRDMMDQTIISSFHYQPLMRIRRIAASTRTGFLIHPASVRIGHPGWTARWLKLYSIHPPKNIVNPIRIQTWRKFGYSIFVWTVNDKKHYDQLCDWGVDGIISDTPETLEGPE